MTTPAWKPSASYKQFLVYANGEGGYYIIVIDGAGGYSFADGFQSRDEAEWTASLLNAAIGAKPEVGGVRT